MGLTVPPRGNSVERGLSSLPRLGRASTRRRANSLGAPMKPPLPLGHTPVLLDETLEHLRCAPGQTYVDGTVGGGGHGRAILERTAPDGRLIGIDWDDHALARAERALESYRGRVLLVRDSFARLSAILEELSIPGVDGILLDLGLSSFHVDDPGRGFSFTRPGPLDMRMDTRSAVTAAELVNTLSEPELADLLYRLGEERESRRIARALVRARVKAPIVTSDRLAELVLAAIRPARRPRARHPATRTFLALRLAVNRELEQLQTFLDGALNCLHAGGRLAIISFHSLEDRLVKQTFARWARTCQCPPDRPACRCGGKALVRPVVRKPILPTPEEVGLNPRARSARLRVVEKVGRP
jgi:16S rRNA (cytosine1402-N4)-methyltransferase